MANKKRLTTLEARDGGALVVNLWGQIKLKLFGYNPREN